MAKWLNIPELEAQIKRADARSPSLLELRDLTLMLARELRVDVQIDVMNENGLPTALRCTRGNRHGGYVLLKRGKFNLSEPNGPELLETITASTEKVVWKLCGFDVTPGEWRVASKRAERASYSQRNIPLKFFVPRMTLLQWRIDRIWPRAGRLLRRFAQPHQR